MAERRIARLLTHLQAASDDIVVAPSLARRDTAAEATAAKGRPKSPILSPINGTLSEAELAALPEPPVLPLAADVLFPAFPAMRQDWERAGKPPLFTYLIGGGTRRMTVVTDPGLFKLIFFPDGTHLTSNQAVLAHHWFGIDKQLSEKYTETSLKATRKALKQSKARGMNDIVGRGILAQLHGSLGDGPLPDGTAGEVDLMELAWLTFWPVNEALFGAHTVSPAVCPHIRADLEQYNESFELVANGMPRAMFPEMEAAAQRISEHFGDKLAAGHATRDDCPVLAARDGSISDADKRDLFSTTQRGRFILSVFWAAQANTVPGTFWALALVLAHPEARRRLEQEARSPAFAAQPDASSGAFDLKPFPFAAAVVKEVLRLKVANITHRKAAQAFAVRAPRDGQTYRVPEGDMLTVCSHLHHLDADAFEAPLEFRPERWLDKAKKPPANSFFPFGGGPNTCSGKFLAEQEIATLLLILFRELDMELKGPVPGEAWENVVAMVTPRESVKVAFTRRNQ